MFLCENHPISGYLNDLTEALFKTSSPAPAFPFPMDILGTMHLGAFLQVQGVTLNWATGSA